MRVFHQLCAVARGHGRKVAAAELLMRGLLRRVRRDEPRFGKALPAGVGRAPPLPALALAGIRRGLPLRTVHVLRLEHLDFGPNPEPTFRVVRDRTDGGGQRLRRRTPPWSRSACCGWCRTWKGGKPSASRCTPAVPNSSRILCCGNSFL